MTDLTNNWPNWGESGSLPPTGFFYSKGDRVNEKHLDALWNNLDVKWTEMINGVTSRIVDLEGNLCLDSGLVASSGGGTTVDVSGTSGAYVNGQSTGAVASDNVTLTSNSTGSTRTDTIQLDDSGVLTANEGSTSADSDKMKIAEVDVTTSDSISDVRQHTTYNTLVFAQEQEPPTPASGSAVWIDTGSSTEEAKFYLNGSWVSLLRTDGNSQMGGDLDLAGNSLTSSTGRISLSSNGEDLEIGEGTQIFDNTGSRRMRIVSNNTTIFDNSDTNAALFDDSLTRFSLVSGKTLDIFDGVVNDKSLEVTPAPDSNSLGTVSIPNANLDGSGNNLSNFSNATLTSDNGPILALEDTGSSPAEDFYFNNGAGKLSLRPADSTNQDGEIMTFDSGGLVSIPSGDLKLSNDIFDSTGTKRFIVNGPAEMRDEGGNPSFKATEDVANFVYARSNTPFRIWDTESNTTGVEYAPSTGTGTLTLPNTDLDMNGNEIKNATGVLTEIKSETGLIVRGNTTESIKPNTTDEVTVFINTTTPATSGPNGLSVVYGSDNNDVSLKNNNGEDITVDYTIYRVS